MKSSILQIVSVIILFLPVVATAADDMGPRVAFIAVESSVQQMGRHNLGAWRTAEKEFDAKLLLRRSDGSFVNTQGQVTDLAAFDVVWYHQGDAIRRTGVYSGKSLAAIKSFAESGGGVLLSGGSLAMVAQLGLEREMRPERHDQDEYLEPAAMIPVETQHPAFTGLKADDAGLVWLSRGGPRAVGDFDWGGPAEAMLLARTPVGPENPLAEYRLGAGRVIVFGWHWPDYADMENPHRPNLLRLTGNLLAYLGDSKTWRPVVIASEYPPVSRPDLPGIAPERFESLRLAINDLTTTGDYPRGEEFIDRLAALQNEHDQMLPSADFTDIKQRFESLKSEALLANPLLDFERLMFIRRRADRLGLLMNAHGNGMLPPTGYGNTLAAMSPRQRDGELTTIYTPPGDRWIGDVDLDFDARRLIFSMPDENNRWRIYELDLATGNAAPLKLIDEPDVHNYDGCYLPDGRIIFTSTAPFIGVPCLGGRAQVANLYLRDHDGSIRRLTCDQDHNWCPTVLNDGRILYQRWEYADIAHAFTRLLFHAFPDGTGQGEHYGSNSFWPTTMFYARPVPNHPTKFVAIVGGHHDAPRQGELILFDQARGRHETQGVIQRIPGRGKPVEPKILDGLVGTSWPRFLHPYPLSDKYFLTACKPTHDSLWGIYLVDVFDNFVLLREEPGQAMFEPIPLRKTARPPGVADRADHSTRDATVLLMDVYRGPGTAGVPRGSIRSLRLISYEFTYHNIGCEPDRVGFDGPWDVKRIIGTVPVEADGSAHFTVPAGIPIALQPLDAEGKAVALMRSWFTARPGEVLSCVGCHEPQNIVPPSDCTPTAVRRQPSAIEPWYGPIRGFSFIREIQPVLDRYCVRCHDGKVEHNGVPTIDLSARPDEDCPSAFNMHFTPAYRELHRWVNVPTLESDAHLLPAYAYHADTSKLVQILRDGHYGVKLNDEAWSRLITWIDLNAPAHGTWMEVAGGNVAKQETVRRCAERRYELNLKYLNVDDDQEAIYPAADLADTSGMSSVGIPVTSANEITQDSTAPTDSSTSTESSIDLPVERVELADGITLSMIHIPAGRFVMGSDNGYENERPAREMSIDRSFLIGQYEITNEQYTCFDPSHDSGLETGEQYQFGRYERGHWLNRADQPVVRISWNRAMEFCRWLSKKTGRHFTLPDQVQWEYACRAGTTSPLWYGGFDDDFSRVANLSDATHYTVDYPHVPTALPPWRPAETRFNDGRRVSAPVGSFSPNPWRLYDMTGNVAEWTRSDYQPTDETAPKDHKVVRGGSWQDRPRRASSSFRQHYSKAQGVHDVGFRVICVD